MLLNEYRYPARTRLLMHATLAFLLLSTLHAIVVQQDRLLGGVLFVISAMNAWMCMQLSVRISVADSSITRHIGFSRAVSLRWDEISSIDRSTMGHLRIENRITRMEIPTQLCKLETLVETIRRKVPQAFPAGIKTFRLDQTSAMLLVLAALALFTIALASTGDVLSRIVLATIAAGMIVLFMSGLRSLTIEQNQLLLVFPLRRLEISKKEIANISWKRVQGQHALSSHGIELQLVNGKKFFFAGCTQSDAVLYHELQVWRQVDR